MNNSDEYTIFDLPIKITNSIPAESNRPSCDSLNNPLLDQATLNASANNFTRIAGSAIQANTGSGSGNGLGGSKPDATPGDGLGGVGMLDWKTTVHSVWIFVFALLIAV